MLVVLVVLVVAVISRDGPTHIQATTVQNTKKRLLEICLCCGRILIPEEEVPLIRASVN